MSRAQPIRPTQFITTYGPGALLEGPGGPRVILALDQSGLFDSESPRNYQIQEPALSAILPDRAQIFRLPTNAERNLTDMEPVYQTAPFPRWSLCVTHDILYRARLEGVEKGCPKCKSFRTKYQAYEEARKEAIRFVVACPAGHLDEVPWDRLMKHSRDCRPEHLMWQGSGGSLRSVLIKCPECEAAANLGDAYQRPLRCRGARPEARQFSSDCKEEARITQRGAANLFVPEVQSAVTIPRLDTSLHQALADPSIRGALMMLQQTTGLQDPKAVRAHLQTMEQMLPPSVIHELAKYSDEVVLAAARDVVAASFPQDAEQARSNEFRELQKAATSGHPPGPPGQLGAPPDFEVIRHDVTFADLGNFRLRIAPISRLRVVMVQTGYRRMGGTTLVSSEYRSGNTLWFPGAELFGEGLFLDLAPAPGSESASDHPAVGPEWSRWLERFRESRRPADHPVYVWWHTLSHRLIRALSIDSGYSSASVRERVYLRVEGERAVGGVLLYAIQPGGDGTLGGLIALASVFPSVLARAVADLDNCSNDPLCEETTIHQGRVNGAACYACCLVSETSCEARNRSLDRLVLQQSGV